MAGSRVFIGDVVSMVFLPAFSALLSISNAFNVCREIVGRAVDNKGYTGFVNATGNGCQSDG